MKYGVVYLARNLNVHACTCVFLVEFCQVYLPAYFAWCLLGEEKQKVYQYNGSTYRKLAV